MLTHVYSTIEARASNHCSLGSSIITPVSLWVEAFAIIQVESGDSDTVLPTKKKIGNIMPL